MILARFTNYLAMPQLNVFLLAELADVINEYHFQYLNHPGDYHEVFHFHPLLSSVPPSQKLDVQ